MYDLKSFVETEWSLLDEGIGGRRNEPEILYMYKSCRPQTFTYRRVEVVCDDTAVIAARKYQRKKKRTRDFVHV